MPDIDSLFADAASNPATQGNYVDVSQEDILNSIPEEERVQPPVQPQPVGEQSQSSEVAGQGQQPDNTTEDGGLLGSLGNAFNALRGGEGSGGSDNWSDSLMGDLRDQIDNTFGGNQLTREEITANMEGKEAERNEARAANPVSATLDEVTGVVQGASVGAVEGALTTGEIIGDTVKTFTGLAQESDQVFSNKYEWAKWNLGKDDVGAKTGVGKVAQGFAEFGIVMAATGGFGGAGAGAGILKSATVSAAKGVASDMILASKGEGNLSNLIKENAPEWYPTWLTALAVDEDDSPWEAMLKTGLEGAGLGILADGAVAGFLQGSKAVRRLLKKNPKATIAEQSAVAIEASQAVVNKPTVPTQQTGAFNDALKTATPERFERMAPLLDQADKGIPVYYDDVANAFPEYFTIPGAGREVLDDFNPAVYGALGKDFTLDPFTGEVPTTGTMVSIDGAVLENVTPDTVANFIAQNRDILSRDDVFLGSWVSDKTGRPVIKLSRRVVDNAEARTLGKVFDQEGVFDLELANRTNFEEGYISTGGTDNLRTTKGGHIGSLESMPSDITPTSPTRALEQQAQVRSMKDIAAPATSGRTVTDAQLKKIASRTSDEAAVWMREFVETNPVDINQLSKISRTTPEQIAAEAGTAIQDSLGTAGIIDFDKILKQGVGEDTLLSPAGIVQVRGLMQEMSSRISAESIAIKKASDGGQEMFTHFDRMVDQVKTLTHIHKESANAYSRYLSTYKVKVPFLNADIEIPSGMQPKSATDLAASIDAANKSLDDLAAKVRSGDPKAKSEAVRLAVAMDLADGDISKTLTFAQHSGRLMGKEALNIMYNSMLSSPATHVINTLSNAMQTVYRPLAAYAGGDAKQKKQAISAFYGFSNNIWESMQLAGKVMQDQVTIKGDKGIAQVGEVKMVMEQLQIGAEATTDLGYKAGLGYTDMLYNVANFPLFSWPSKLLTTSDEFFKSMIARMEFQSRTMGEAIDAADGAPDGIEAAYKHLLEKTHGQNFTKSGEILNDDLLAVAKEGTFQTELEGAAKAFGDFVNSVPVLRAFFPFIKTGHNIMAYTASHVPVLNKQLTEYKAVMAGTDEYAKAVFKGRQAYGQMIITAGAVAAFTGGITGNGPPDPAERKIWLQTNQPRSFKFGDKFVDYSRIEPFGQILSAVADLVDMGKYAVKHGIGGDQMEYLAGYLTYAIANNFTNKSYMQGVVPLGKMLTPGWQGMGTLASLAPSQINNFIPLSGARRAFSNAITPNMMEYQSQVDRVWASMGLGGRPFGAVSHDWLDGSPLESPSGGVNAINPLKVVTRKQSVVRDALEDIGYDSSVIAETLKGVELSSEQLSKVQKLMGGSGLEDRLKVIVTDPRFKVSRDLYFSEVRGNFAVDKKNYWYYDTIQKEVINTRDWALRRLQEEYPEIGAEIQANTDAIQQRRTEPFESIKDFHKQ
jgi:hypothetical protein